jgi:NADPH:quinone reductase-like Zn-dependent oxidoreductase
MRAIVYERYGPPEVLQIREVEKPVPNENEVLVKIHATSVTAGDGRMRRADPYAARLFNGLLRPKRVTIPGFELAGKVEAVGTGVQRFTVGDPVCAFTGFGFGAYAEYRCIAEEGTVNGGIVARRPANLTYEEAAAVPVGGLTAIWFFKKTWNPQRAEDPGLRCLRKHRHVLDAACPALRGRRNRGKRNREPGDGAVARSRYGHRLHEGKFTKAGQAYDLVFDAVGRTSRSQCRNLLNRGGVFLSTRGSAEGDALDLAFLAELVEAGEIRPVLFRCYPLDQIAEAHRYVEGGHKKGNVVISVVSAGER